MRLGVAIVAAAVVALSAVPRILLAADVLPDALRPFVWSDVLLVYVRGLSGHRLPYVDTAFEYPPLVALVSGSFSSVSDSAVVFVTLWAALQAVLAGTIAWTLAGAGGVRATTRRFALAPQLFLLGAANFDLVAVAFICAALVAIKARRETATASLLAFGTLSKLFPIAAAPILIARAARPVRAALVGVAILGAAYFVASLAGRSGATAPLYYLFGIDPNFDSPWGLLTITLAAAGLRQPEPIIVAVTIVGLIATYLVAVLPRARAADPAIPFGLAVVTTLLWSRLYSPQYSLWVLPLFVVLPLSSRLFALLCVGDVLVFATVYPLTITRWAPGDPRAAALFAVLVAGVALRTLGLAKIWLALQRLARPTATPAVRPT